jgi:hypothetical protein
MTPLTATFLLVLFTRIRILSHYIGNANCKGCIIILPLVTFFHYAFAQSPTTDTSIHQAGIDKVYQFYMSSIGGASILYNGSEYTGSYPGTKGKPFFGSEDFQPGEVCYYGITYKNVPMAFDMVINVLAIKGYQGLYVQLNTVRIDSFSLMGHKFIHLKKDSTFGNIPTDDFYDVIYNGPNKVLVKRFKIVSPGFSAEDLFEFRQYNIYYILKNRQYYRIGKKKSLMNLFKDHSKEIKAYWKTHKLDYKKDKENAILQTASYYGQLKQ